MSLTGIIYKIINIIYIVTLIGVGLFLLYVLLQVTTACSFHTPSGSMQPTLRPDESGLVNKWKLGARIFDIFDAIEGKPYEIRRLPVYGSLERGDVIIFNYPYLDSDKKRDSIAMNLATYYCKRAVAVAGDTLEIKDCFYRVRGCCDTLGVASEQMMLRRLVADHSRVEPDSSKWPGWMRCHPKDSIFGWTVKEMGPLVIPCKGMKIRLDLKNWILYRKYIEWETKRKLVWQDSIALMDGKAMINYTFTEDYCFVAGDHVVDSRDSRYFGLVPEKFIVGTAGVLWRSKDNDRIFSILNKR
ncbi:S26 family signal peptidase [uncultured Duncaniella sp.]|uniref:S26 family signal peptidase n=1 Tax=uncultured Duncaniella sp. TaxID=2768039 RepID=UPI002731F287|nr:S26 family signal peptidase [uncultured Duncaniella sp.]